MQGRQGFLYDVASPFFIAPYHFDTNGSLRCTADRFFLYNVTPTQARTHNPPAPYSAPRHTMNPF